MIGRLSVRTNHNLRTNDNRSQDVGEPLFVPRRAESAEDDGYVLAIVYDQSRNASDFMILDARSINAEPVARIPLPHRVPYGFHGNWVPAEARSPKPDA